MAGLEVEWAAVAPDKVVIATADRISLHQPSLMSPFAVPMRGDGSPAVTRQLLEGATEVGRSDAGGAPAPPLTLARWVEQLCQYYWTTQATPRGMARAADAFARAGRRGLATWAASKVRDERGHDELALRDLRALGLDAAEIVSALRPRRAVALVDYFTRAVESMDPIDCVGYAYVLESSALWLDSAGLRRIEAVLPPEVDATRCARVHSALGSDVHHVDELVETVAGLCADERARVAVACYQTALILFGSHDRQSDAELNRLMQMNQRSPSARRPAPA